MQKQELITELKAAILRGEITQRDLTALYESPASSHTVIEKSSKVATVLYYIGGLIIFLGLTYFVSQKWTGMSSPLRILVTLGFGIGFSISGTMLFMKHLYRGIGDAFHLISGLMIPSGIFVTLYELHYVGGRFGTAIIFITLALLAYIEFHTLKRVISLVWTWIYGSLGYLLLGSAVINGSPLATTWDLPAYLFLTMGIAYITIGYALAKKDGSVLTPAMYFFGAPIVLGSTLYLQGYYPTSENLFWEIVYPAILFGTMFFSVYIKSRSFLIFGTLFLLGYIGKIMAEYFANDLNGPILLIISGIIVMGIGYMTYWLNHRYFGENRPLTSA